MRRAPNPFSAEGRRPREVRGCRERMAALSILRPGLLTTVQDLGRWGFQSRGVPVSGAMDWFSHRLANRLVGNLDRRRDARSHVDRTAYPV